MEYIPYTYLIGWSALNKWYYGVEYARKTKIANPTNLWTSYFTSSKLVSYYRAVYGEPDVIQVRTLFNVGSDLERMERAATWEKKVLSRIKLVDPKWLNGRIGGNICPALISKVAMLRYGVTNVFAADEVKEKIKKTNIKKYGVEHPSLSKELLEKKQQNNISKYGVSSNLLFPETQIKARLKLGSAETINKRKQTILNKYKVEYISQAKIVKEKVQNTHRKKAARDIVKLIKEYQRVFNVVLTSGWYQLSDEILNQTLATLQAIHGIYTHKELLLIKVPKKYSSSIKRLQEREIVKEIKKYKDKYGRKLVLGRSWDRKNEEVLQSILQSLINQYGPI